MPAPHLVAVVSGHGFGHAMQTCLVINALRRHLPELRVTLRSDVPETFLASRLHGAFELQPATTEFGMQMHSAMDVDVPASARRYAEFHAAWDNRVEAEATALAELRPDLVFADISYLALAAARHAGIPAVALCSLNWADIYRHYCYPYPEASRIHADMLAAYRSAEVFLQPAPHMPMSDLSNTRRIGPLAQIGQARRAELRAHLGVAPDTRVVLVGLGGIEMSLDMADWPAQAGTVWLVPAAWQVRRADVFSFAQTGWPFIDVLASSDVLLTKPGYGSFTEAVCNGVRVLYSARPDWPETEHLASWLHRRGRALEVARADLERGNLKEALQTVSSGELGETPPASGAEDAAEILSAFWHYETCVLEF